MHPNTRLTLRIVETISFGLGPAIAALNLFSFSLTRGGNIFYKDANSWGIAVGIFLICIAIVANRWQR